MDVCGAGPQVEDQHVEELPDHPFVRGDDRRAFEDLDCGGTEPDGEPAAGEPGRNRVGALPHRHPRLRVDPGQQQPGGVERLGRQWHQRGGLGGERGGDGTALAGDHPAIVDRVAGGDQAVQCGQRCRGWDGDEMAAEPADVALDSALLVGAGDAGAPEE